VVALIGIVAVGAFVFRGKDAPSAIQYEYSKVQRGEVSQSIEATGTIVPLTQVDVKSKAGGIVEKLFVDQGSVVKKGQLIALIDPRDTQSSYEQAAADLSSSQALAQQAQDAYGLQKKQSTMGVESAQEALNTAEIALHKAKIQMEQQPALSSGALASAEADYQGALSDYQKLSTVTIPQTKRDESGAVAQTKAQRDSDQAQVTRDENLLTKGYISQSQIEKDRATAAVSEQAYELAKQRFSTLTPEVNANLRSQKETIARLKAALSQAQAGMSNNQIAITTYQQAQKAVDSARTALDVAIANQANNQIKKEDVLSANSNIVRNRVAEQNAMVQLQSTTVVAPRDGVVTTKYLEEGTIIPPGTSVYAQGTSLVQLSDVSKLYADCTVDEADVAAVKVGQKVKIVAEAYKESPVWGRVVRVDPAAVTASNVTTVLARVLVLPHQDPSVKLLPGMNTSCDFLTMDRENVLYVPNQAIQQDEKGTFVLTQSADPLKPTKVYVQTGASGDDNTEITSGLKEGESIVTATINIAQDEAIQKQMEQAAQGGGLAGGGGTKMKSYATKTKKKK